ncbi:hypothetical protein U9M48_044843, partial [Paspalum notatum var. saurae]
KTARVQGLGCTATGDADGERIVYSLLIRSGVRPLPFPLSIVHPPTNSPCLGLRGERKKGWGERERGQVGDEKRTAQQQEAEEKEEDALEGASQSPHRRKQASNQACIWIRQAGRQAASRRGYASCSVSHHRRRVEGDPSWPGLGGRFLLPLVRGGKKVCVPVLA